MVTAATLGASALLALTGGSLNEPSHLRALDPATLQPVGASVRLPSWAFGFAWARRGPLVAIVARPAGGYGYPIRIVDVRRMRTIATIGVGDRDVAGLTFRGKTLVALTSDQPSYWRNGHFSLLRFDLTRRRVATVTAVPRLRTVFPTNLAFGDGFAFAARAGGGVDAVDLGTGTVTRHTPKRSLAKGEGIVPTRWLGRHQLGVGARVVDVRTWRARVFEPGARGVAPAGADVAVYGTRGVALYTRAGRLRFRVLSGVTVDNVHVRGRYLYAGAGPTANVVDLRTRRETRAAADPSIVWTMLAS